MRRSVVKNNNETAVTFKVFNKEYRQGIKEMTKDSQELRQELKLSQEQLKLAGTQTEKLSSTLSSLEKQHEIAKQKTAATSEALDQAKILFGENSEAVGVMEKSLRAAQIEEQQLANKITKTKDELEKAKKAESDRSKSLKDLESEQTNLKNSSELLTKEYELQKLKLGDNASASEKLKLEQSYLEKQMQNSSARTQNLSEQLQLAEKHYGANSQEVQRLKSALANAQIEEQQMANKIAKTKDELEKAIKAESDRVQTLKALEKEQKNLKSSSEQLSKEYEIQKLKLGANASESKKLKLEQDYLEKQMQNSADQAVNLSQQLQLTAEQFGENSDEVRQLKGELADAQIAALEFSNKFKESTDGLKQFGEKAGEVGSTMQSFGKKMSLAITAPVTAFGAGLVKMGVDVRKFRAQAQIYYEGLYQDTNKAKQQLDDLMTFARTTPYSYESLVEADMVMQTFGMSTEKAKTSLEAIANAIASTGGESADLERIATVFGQIESSGKLSLQDMNQLVNAKIPALKIVANELGISVMDLRDKISKGEVSSEQAIQSLTKGLMEGTDGINGATQAYSGSLDKVKQQLPGAIDSMKSAIKNMSLDVVDEEAFDGIIEAINKITSMINEGNFEPMIKAFGEALNFLVDGLGNLAEWFGNLDPEIQGMIMKMLLFAAAIGPVLVVMGKLLGAVSAIILFIQGPALAALLPMLPWFAAIVLAILAVIAVVKNWGEISQWFSDLWSATKDKVSKVFEGIGQSINDGFKATGDFFKDIGEKIQETYGDIKQGTIDFFTNIGEAIAEGYGNLKSTVINFFSGIGEWFSDLWQGIKDGAIAGWESLTETLEPYIDFFVRAIKMPISLLETFMTGIWLLIKAGLEIAWEAIKIAAQFAWEQIKDYIISPIVSAYDFIVVKLTQLGEWMAQKWQEILSILQSAWDTINQAAAFSWDLFTQFIIDPIVSLYDWMIQKFSALGDWLARKWEEMKETAGNTWESIKDAMVRPVIDAYDTTLEKVEDLKNSFSTKFTEILDKTKEIFTKVGDAMTRPINAAKDGIGEAIDSIQNFFKNLKFPEFSLKVNTKTILGKEITYPSGIDVKWNAKGGIFKKPMIAGYSGGKFQGVGEAGPEAVLPLNSQTLGDIGRGILSNINFSDFAEPILSGIQDAAAVRAEQNSPQSQENNRHMEHLLAQLLETLRNKEFTPTIVVQGNKGQTGFARHDGLNRNLNQAAGSLNSGLVNP